MRTLDVNELEAVAGGRSLRREGSLNDWIDAVIGSLTVSVHGSLDRTSGGGGSDVDWNADPSSWFDVGAGPVGTASPVVPDWETMVAWDVKEWTDFFAMFTQDWSKAKAAAFTATLASLSQHPVCKAVGVDDYLKAMAIWIPTGDPFWMASETRNELNEWPKDKKEIFINLVVEALRVVKDVGKVRG